uniref:HTH psq-type domain-containing protein n=1 Tax=Hippocampus comes TaxID=109280 RepID=A0A3Q2YBS2_HIPCM
MRIGKSSCEPKQKRKIMTVNEKLDNLLDMFKAGHNYTYVALHYRLNESTVHCMKKDELKIRNTASISFSKDTKRVMTSLWTSDYWEKKVMALLNKD